MLRRLVATILPLLALGAFPSLAQAAAGYVSPFAAPGYLVGRTDMGVDVCLSPGDPIAAVGDGIVIGIQRNWFGRQPYLWYELTSGPYAGRFVYVAEQITDLARVGQHLAGGQAIATYARRGTCIETGWAAADGQTLASATTGYSEGQVTSAGISFARFLISLGVQGAFELTAPRAARAPGPARTGSGRVGAGRKVVSSRRHASRRPTPPAPTCCRPSGGAASGPIITGGAAWSASAPAATGPSAAPGAASGGGGLPF